MAKRSTLYCFTRDLRLRDNPALQEAMKGAGNTLFFYCVDPAWFKPNRYGLKSIGERRWVFLLQSLASLDANLKALGQKLHVWQGHPALVIRELLRVTGAERLGFCQLAGYYETQLWQQLREEFPSVEFTEGHGTRLLRKDQLPFDCGSFPATFSQFRKLVEPMPKPPALQQLVGLPSPLPLSQFSFSELTLPGFRFGDAEQDIVGGEQAGYAHLHQYFNRDAASRYFETRNSLDDPQASTGFSPWLSAGCLSPWDILRRLHAYEAEHGANKSTYWIQFELLWREYFQWYADQFGSKLFQVQGIHGQPPLTSYYPTRFRQWQQGTTPFPLVNACMNQLRETGGLSNRGRQIAASCLVNELDMDWRYGAAWFEECLIDYDVASNWGNWQYLAGVGCDPRGKRRFNLEKQREDYDPGGDYVRRWSGNEQLTPLHSVGINDWPLEPDK